MVGNIGTVIKHAEEPIWIVSLWLRFENTIISTNRQEAKFIRGDLIRFTQPVSVRLSVLNKHIRLFESLSFGFTDEIN